MRGVNKVILIGTAGADPETRYGANGTAITMVKLATNESWKDKTTGAMQERTEWHRVKFFGRLAEIASEYVRKGKSIYIEGKLRTDKYTDKEGVERYTTDILADELQLLGSKESGGAPAPAPARPAARAEPGRRELPPMPKADQDFDDEIPF